MAIDTELSAPIATVTLAEPDRRNPLGLETLRALDSTLSDVGDRRDIGAVVIAARGPVFSAGHDLREMAGGDESYMDDLFAACVDLMMTMRRIPQPVIGKVSGVATAAGCQLVAGCDLAVASTDASFATPGVRIGLFCSTPMVPLSRAIGSKRALEMLLTGEPISAATAAAWGLVNRVVEPDQLDAAVDELTARITSFSTETVAIGKEAFYRQVDVAEADAYELTRHVMAANAVTPDAREGVDAFLSKRDPAWRGR